MLSNIIVIGGTSKLPHFLTRLMNETRSLSPSLYDVRVVSPPDPSLAAWKGGTLLASHPNFTVCFCNSIFISYLTDKLSGLVCVKERLRRIWTWYLFLQVQLDVISIASTQNKESSQHVTFCFYLLKTHRPNDRSPWLTQYASFKKWKFSHSTP